MTNLKGNFAVCTNRTGLYRVWVPLRDDGKGPLISIWIDPAVTALEPDARENSATVSSIGEKETRTMNTIMRLRRHQEISINHKPS